MVVGSVQPAGAGLAERRLSIIYEARGERIKAAECYRKVIEFDRRDLDHHHTFEAAVQSLTDKLDLPLEIY